VPSAGDDGGKLRVCDAGFDETFTRNGSQSRLVARTRIAGANKPSYLRKGSRDEIRTADTAAENYTHAGGESNSCNLSLDEIGSNSPESASGCIEICHEFFRVALRCFHRRRLDPY